MQVSPAKNVWLSRFKSRFSTKATTRQMHQAVLRGACAQAALATRRVGWGSWVSLCACHTRDLQKNRHEELYADREIVATYASRGAPMMMNTNRLTS